MEALIADNQVISAFGVLPWKDSNPHRRNQNPTCYHYTTRQFHCKGRENNYMLVSLSA